MSARTRLTLEMEDVTALLGAVRSYLSDQAEQLGDAEALEVPDLDYLRESVERLDRLEKRINAAGLRLQRVLSK